MRKSDPKSRESAQVSLATTVLLLINAFESECGSLAVTSAEQTPEDPGFRGCNCTIGEGCTALLLLSSEL